MTKDAAGFQVDVGEFGVVIQCPMVVLAMSGGRMTLSPAQAWSLARALEQGASEAEAARRRQTEEATRAAAAAIPVDRTCKTMTDGSPVAEDHREIDPATGMQKGYVVLCPEERAKGYVRPLRRSYTHKTCGSTTTMGLAIAETYARDPGFYGGTFCVHCRTHFPLDQFVWEGTTEQVGS